MCKFALLNLSLLTQAGHTNAYLTRKDTPIQHVTTESNLWHLWADEVSLDEEMIQYMQTQPYQRTKTNRLDYRNRHYCGNHTSSFKVCKCSTSQIQRYRRKISGPLLDRIDIHIEVPQLKYEHLTTKKEEEPSGKIRERVGKARKIQLRRFKAEGVFYNAQMNARMIKKYCVLEDEAKELLKMAMTELGLEAIQYRSLDR